MPYNISFEGPFNYWPQLYGNIGIIYTIHRYVLLYNIYSFDWFETFRKDLFNIVKIMGGTEVIYIADNGCDKLCTYLECMAEENMPYEEIKQKMIDQFGQPITEYSKLNVEALSYESIKEFFLDDFSDLK